MKTDELHEAGGPIALCTTVSTSAKDFADVIFFLNALMSGRPIAASMASITSSKGFEEVMLKRSTLISLVAIAPPD
jgi:hypothetical protein